MRLTGFILCLSAALIQAVPLNGTADRWASIRDALQSWYPCLLALFASLGFTVAYFRSALQFDTSFSVSVGDSSGPLFEWATPGFSIDDTRMPGASLSKWPSAVMISGLVHDGILSYDDRASKHLEWWTTDAADPRSGVTLRQLLSFTSGFTADAMVVCSALNFGFERCAERLYKASHKYTTPGTTWTYLSCHLQFAAAMAVSASGIPIDQLYEKYLYKPFNMTSTTWSPKNNPSIAAGITTTARDFENLLSGLLTYRVLPKQLLDQMETDLSQAPISPSGDGWFGHYGMYGFYPLLDRSGGGSAAGPAREPYYFSLALAESFSLSGIPEYLRLALKPMVDVVLSGGDPDTASRAQLLSQGAGLLRRDFEDIESALSACTCDGTTAEGEPYKTLSSGMPKDDPTMSRQQISAQGVGLLLRDLVQAQAKLGNCKCKGRK